MGKELDICTVKIKNVAGVPVIEIIGVLNRAAVSAVENTINQLASAGHYNIVLNVKRALAANLTILESLADSVKQIRSHYGSVELVAEAGQITQVPNAGSLFQLFRFCVSEGQAFQRIKKLLRPDDDFQGAPVRLGERV
jgi:hypothetical protein